MKALIWKEIRETALWAALIAAGLLLAGTFMLRNALAPPASGLLYGSAFGGIDRAYGAFKLILQIGAPMSGLLLGWLQITRERKGDERAFLLHRPVAASTIFLSKVAAGSGLYLLATGVPSLAMTIWLAIPGHFPCPFPASLALPDITAILAGLLFYFASMMVALRQARWWGSKFVPIISALGCSSLIDSVYLLSVALTVAAVSIFAYFVAALGCFTSNGEYDRVPRGQRAALGFILLIGVTEVATVAVGFVLGALAATHPSRPSTEISSVPTLALDRQNHLVQLEVTGSGYRRVFDAAGQQIRGLRPRQEFNGDFDASEYDSMIVPRVGGTDRFGYASWQQYYEVFDSPTGSGVGDYDVYDYANRVVDVYSYAGNRLIGYLGTSGTTEPTIAAAGQFPAQRMLSMLMVPPRDWQQRVLLAFPTAIYTIDRDAQHIAVVYRPRSGELFDGVASARISSRPGVVTGGFVVATAGSRFAMFDTNGATVASLPLIGPLKDWNSIAVWARHPPRPFYMLYSPRNSTLTGVRQIPPGRFVTAVAPGRVIASIPVQTLDFRPPTTLLSPKTATAPAVVVPIVTVVPAAVLWLLYAPTDYAGSVENMHRVRSDPLFIPACEWLCVWACLGALIAALIFLALSRPYGWNRRDTIKWMVGGALLSWPGILMLLAMVPLPLRIECPSCRQKRLASRTTCEHCGAATQPRRDGTEIFESDNSDQRHSAVTG